MSRCTTVHISFHKMTRPCQNLGTFPSHPQICSFFCWDELPPSEPGSARRVCCRQLRTEALARARPASELHGAGRDVKHGRVELLASERRPFSIPALLQHLVHFLQRNRTRTCEEHNGHANKCPQSSHTTNSANYFNHFQSLIHFYSFNSIITSYYSL